MSANAPVSYDRAGTRLADVAIVGSGISGLAAAHRLRELRPDLEVVILEASSRPGGVLQTERRDGFVIEAAADSFITTMPWAIDLCRRLGLEDRIIETAPEHRRAFVVRRGRLMPIPDGLMIMAPNRIGPLVSTPILSPLGKLRMAWERFVPPGDGGDESLASFARRRFGREAFDRLIQPMVSGMYTGDPECLSVKATMPRFLDMEREHGSLIRAMRRNRATGREGDPRGSGARYSLFVGLRGGMSDLVDALVSSLGAASIECGAIVQHIARDPIGGWRLSLASGGTVLASGLILATPVPRASALLAGIDRTLSDLLDRIPTSRTAIATLGYRRDQIAHPLDGFGFVVPSVEGSPILSGSFSSVKFPGRSPEGHALIRVFLGGVIRSGILEKDDPSLMDLAHRELSRLLAIRGEPVLRQLHRWSGVMPQYQVGHLERVAEIDRRIQSLHGLALAGNALRGVGIPQCIQSGEHAAELLARALPTSRSQGECRHAGAASLHSIGRRSNKE